MNKLLLLGASLVLLNGSSLGAQALSCAQIYETEQGLDVAPVSSEQVLRDLAKMRVRLDELTDFSLKSEFKSLYRKRRAEVIAAGISFQKFNQMVTEERHQKAKLETETSKQKNRVSRDENLLQPWVILREFKDLPIGNRELKLSPDGYSLMGFSDKGAGWILDTRLASSKPFPLPLGPSWSSSVYSSDGKRVAAFGAHESLSVYSLDQKRLERQYASQGYSSSLSFAPDGKSILMRQMGQPAVALDLDSGELLQKFGSAHDYRQYYTSPDGNFIFINNNRDQKFEIWNITTATRVRSFTTEEFGDFRIPVANQDGSVWAFYDIRSLGIFQQAKSEAFLKIMLPDHLSFTALSPDGTKFLTMGSNLEVRIYDLQTGKFKSGNFPSGFLKLQWSPDGRSIMTLDPDYQIRFWDTETLEVTQQVLTSHKIRAVQFWEDGTHFVTLDEQDQLQIWGRSGSEDHHE